MAKTAKINVKDGDLVASLQEFFTSILQLDDISAVLVPQQLPMKNMVMPTLVTDPDSLDNTDPLAPVFPMNNAKLVSRLTRRPSGGKIAAIMRPCEIRALFELVKLKQATVDDLYIIGIDCLGAYQNTDYFKIVGESVPETTRRFYQGSLSGKENIFEGVDLSPACRACEFPVPKGADILIGLFGIETGDHLLAQSQTEKGEELLGALDFPGAQVPTSRNDAIEALIAGRAAYRDEMMSETREATNSIEKLTTYLANCINCYNCRVACPVCYCKECVFVTDVFDHEPSQYLRWAGRKGCIKMPTDTVFYHLTRIAHMSTSCVGCGQCSNACPNDVPVMELFRTVSEVTQKAFDYEAGRSIEENPPLSEFRENEFAEVVGIGRE